MQLKHHPYCQYLLIAALALPVFDDVNQCNDGEAFFDVTENKNELLVVNSNAIKVEVYGTKFNVRNYSEDFNSDIVLVEGSVGINNSEVSELTMLKPGFKGSVDKENFRVNNDSGSGVFWDMSSYLISTINILNYNYDYSLMYEG